MLVRRSTIGARALFQTESPCLLNWMVALLFAFGSPEKDALTLIASKVEDSVKDPGVVDAKAEPEKRGRSTNELPSTVSHDVGIIFLVISRRPPASGPYVEDSLERGRQAGSQPLRS